jgi:hypothetical protein
MNRILRLAAVLAGALLAFAMATATALAGSYPITGAPSGTAPAPRIPLPCTPQCAAPAPPVPAVTHTVVIGGMPGWQIVLITAGAALVAAAVAVLAERARAARQRVTTTAT